MKGLNDEEVKISRLKYGSNKIDIKSDNKFIKLFIASLGDPIIKIMLIALAIRFVLMFSDQSWYETLGMLFSILLSSLISSLSEYGSNKSFRILQEKYSNNSVNVIRNGVIKSIDANDVVVDDLVILETGNLICADGEIVDGSIYVDEKVINGESEEVFKGKKDKLFKGTVVLSDKCTMKVLRVGKNTLMGNIISDLNIDENISPMKERLTRLAKTISYIGYVGAFLSVVSYLINVIFISNNFDMEIIKSLFMNPKYIFDLIIHAFTIGLTILLLIVPEGLPMMTALVLSSNMKIMLKNNVLVRKPVGIETSGSLNVLLTDKTGTLTVGNLSVVGILDYDGNQFQNVDELNEELFNSLLYNNNSSFENGMVVSSNSTDKAILKFIGSKDLKYSIKSRINFNSKDKYSSVTLENNKTYYKGAYEVLINKVRYYLDNDGKKHLLINKDQLNNILVKYTSRGYRVIISVMDNVFLGFILLRDEIRSDAINALESIKNAYIDVIMITGDDLLTAKSIASDLNLLDDNSLVLSHDSFEAMSDAEILNNYKRIKVIARALPSDKARMAKILKSNDLVVGMTGDGVNDAPALKVSDVGFSLGSGSDVAKEASDIVIIDDNIKSISNAILYGRTIFKSIRKFIIFQLTMNVTALFLSIVCPFIGITSPVTVMQMLWINMIMDTFAGLAYSYEIPLIKYMREVPISKKENIINKYMYTSIITIGIYTCVMLVLFLKLDIFKLIFRSDTKYMMTAFFSLFIFSSIFNSFNARTTNINIFRGILKNKVFLSIMILIFILQVYLIYFGGNLFRTYGLEVDEFIYIILISSSVILVDSVKKFIFKKLT